MARDSSGLAVRKWAKDQTDAAVVGAPDQQADVTRALGFGLPYAVDRYISLPSFNGMFRELTGLLKDIEAHGVLEWDASVSPGYGHPCLVWGSDGELYESVQAGGQARDPTTDDSNAYWRLAIAVTTTGGVAGKRTGAAADVNVLASDDGKTIEVSAETAARTVNLPDLAAEDNGVTVTVVKSDTSANAVSIDGHGDDAISGVPIWYLRDPWDAAVLKWTGSRWIVIAMAQPWVGTALRNLLDTGNFNTGPVLNLRDTGRTSNSITWAWAAPKTGDAATKYRHRHRVSPSGDWSGWTETALLTFTATGLTASTLHEAEVQSGNATGWGIVARDTATTNANAPSPGSPIEGPDVEGPDVEGPPVEGPNVAGPPVEGPDVPSGSVEGPDVEGPDVEGPPVEGPDWNQRQMRFRYTGPEEGPPVEPWSAWSPYGSSRSIPWPASTTETPNIGPTFSERDDAFRNSKVEGPDVEGPPVEGPPVEGPNVGGPPVEGPPVAGSPVEGPDVEGPPVEGPPVEGPDL